MHACATKSPLRPKTLEKYVWLCTQKTDTKNLSTVVMVIHAKDRDALSLGGDVCGSTLTRADST